MPTTFLPLEPQGLGTSDIEALDSYALRLAAEHGISEYQFHRVLAYWWNHTKAAHEQTLGRHVAYITKVGHGRDIDVLVRAIERGTGFSSLSGMTLSAFRDVSGTHVGDIVRKIRQWCPACLREWETAGAPMYEKLLWRLDPITRCNHHEIALVDRCPACGIYQVRHEDTWPKCFSCGAHLAGSARLWRVARRPADGESDLIQVIEYCANHPNMTFDGNAVKCFWQLIRDTRSTTHRITGTHFHHSEKAPRTLISVLLRFANDVGVPLLSILVDPSEASSICPLIEAQPIARPHRRLYKLSPNDREDLRKDLLVSTWQESVAPSLHTICIKHKCSKTFARYWYPDLVRSLMTLRCEQGDDLRRERDRRLSTINIDDAMMVKAKLVGWRTVARDIALDLNVPIRLARERISALRYVLSASAKARHGEAGHQSIGFSGESP